MDWTSALGPHSCLKFKVQILWIEFGDALQFVPVVNRYGSLSKSGKSF
jgi:hypothetical protein